MEKGRKPERKGGIMGAIFVLINMAFGEFLWLPC